MTRKLVFSSEFGGFCGINGIYRIFFCHRGHRGHRDLRFFRQGKSKTAKGKSDDSPMGWTFLLNVSFFCFQIALLLEALMLRGVLYQNV